MNTSLFLFTPWEVKRATVSCNLSRNNVALRVETCCCTYYHLLEELVAQQISVLQVATSMNESNAMIGQWQVVLQINTWYSRAQRKHFACRCLELSIFIFNLWDIPQTGVVFQFFNYFSSSDSFLSTRISLSPRALLLCPPCLFTFCTLARALNWREKFTSQSQAFFQNLLRGNLPRWW